MTNSAISEITELKKQNHDLRQLVIRLSTIILLNIVEQRQLIGIGGGEIGTRLLVAMTPIEIIARLREVSMHCTRLSLDRDDSHAAQTTELRGIELETGAKTLEVADAPHQSEVLQQLGRIVQSAAFRDSLRLTRFLTFIVETKLAGNSDRIKAYTIAIEALGRSDDFDPNGDSIVRVEAGRLRLALARYYADAGNNDPLVIDVPCGTYVPVFRRIGAKVLRASPMRSTQLSLNRRESDAAQALERLGVELAIEAENLETLFKNSWLDN